MIKNILFIQPTAFGGEGFSEVFLFWPVYLKTFLNSRIPKLNFDFMHLQIEEKKGTLELNSLSNLNKFHSQMDKFVSQLDFSVNKNTFICLSGTTSNHFLSSKVIAEYFKKYFPDSPVGFGGTHATVCPDDFNYEGSPIDYVFLGEGEISFYELIKNSVKKRNKPSIIVGKPIPKMDDLPPLDYSIYDKYISYFDKIGLQISRGCPYNCNFCIEKRLLECGQKTKSWRVYSPQRAISEVSNLLDFGLKHNITDFGFLDAIFGLNKKWVDKFLDLYNFEQIKSAIIETRLDIVNQDLLQRLQNKRFFIMYGFESYSERVLTAMNKTQNPQHFKRQFDEIMELHKRLEYLCSLFVFCGHPSESEYTYNQTFTRLEELITDDKSDSFFLVIRYYHHFPGTFVYNNIDDFVNTYGTHVYYPEWWRSEELASFGAYCVRPSEDLSLRKSYSLYSEEYKKLLKLNMESLKDNKPQDFLLKMFQAKKEIKNLELKDKSFLEFLDKQNIN